MGYDRYGNYLDEGEERSGTPTDIGHALGNKVNVSEDGHLKIFGKEIDVGRNGAIILGPLVDTLINQVSLRGASTAARFGTSLSQRIMPKHWAGKVGKGIGFAWLFGLSAADVALGIKKTVTNGFKDMHELRDKWQPLLAATNNMDVGVGKALTCNCGVFAHARARVYEKSKHSLLGTIAGGIGALPNIISGIYQHQMDDIMNPKRVLQARKHKGMSMEERKETADLINTLRSKRSKPESRRPAKEQDLISSLSRLFTDPDSIDRLRRPKNEQDLRENIRALAPMPALFGLGGELLERHISKQDDSEDAGEKILELQSYVHNHDQPDHERVVTYVRDIFQQRARDLHRTYELEGDTYDRVIEAVADAVVFGLHPQAIALALDNKKIVSFDKKAADFGGMENVKKALEELKEKFTPQVSKKEFYKNEPLDEKEVARIFKEMPESEKAVLATVFPLNILEKTIGKADARKYHAEGKKILTDGLTDVLKTVMETSPEELKARGVKSKVIDEVKAYKEAFHRAVNNDHGDEFLEKDPEKAKRVVRHVMLSAKNPGELWKDFVKKRESEGAARNLAEERKGVDHMTDDMDDGAGIPGR